MSIRFNLIKGLMRLSGVKKTLSLPQDQLLANARKQNRSRKLKSRKNFRYSDEVILSNHHCLKIRTQASPSKRVLLFLYGGGHILAPNDGDLKLAEKLGKDSGRDVYFPLYPLCIDNSVMDAHEMITAVYEKMLEEYEPENIAFIGFSSGGALAISVCLQNNAKGGLLPMPGVIIASSPGCVPVSLEEKQEMARLSLKDIAISDSFMETIKAIMEHGRELPDYMISGILGDFTNFPMTHFYYGGDEVLYAEAPYFAKAYEKYNVPYEMHVGKGMCHCYPVFSFYPEGRRAQEEIIQILKSTRSHSSVSI